METCCVPVACFREQQAYCCSNHGTLYTSLWLVCAWASRPIDSMLYCWSTTRDEGTPCLPPSWNGRLKYKEHEHAWLNWACNGSILHVVAFLSTWTYQQCRVFVGVDGGRHASGTFPPIDLPLFLSSTKNVSTLDPSRSIIQPFVPRACQISPHQCTW